MCNFLYFDICLLIQICGCDQSTVRVLQQFVDIVYG